MSRYGEPVDAAERWNERYSRGFEAFGGRPAAWLVEHETLLSGDGRALDVACGDGRNAAHLARLGYDVDAIDVSEVAVGALRAAAPEHGLAITAWVVDHHEGVAARPGGPRGVESIVARLPAAAG